tara:strand:- start:284 stop:442 length:159 start_codon:yes stop_codon:yes gene_type:complete
MSKPTMAGIFRILERLNMCFPNARSGLDDKVRFEEKLVFKLTSDNGKEVRGN